jgi:hypothetical protein
MAVTDLIDTPGHAVADAIAEVPGLVLDSAGDPLTITGDAASDVITTSDLHHLQVGMRVTFATLTGGTGLVVGKAYYVATVPSPTTLTHSRTHRATQSTSPPTSQVGRSSRPW